MGVAGAVEVRKEGLDAQINRLAELIGRLENKVKKINEHTHALTVRHTRAHAQKPPLILHLFVCFILFQSAVVFSVLPRL